MQTENIFTFLPQNTIEVTAKWIENGDFVLKIAKPRNTKLGDFRASVKTHLPQITVNANLEPYLFFFIFTHEYAHYLVWKQFKRAKAHGKQWKDVFSELLNQTADLYPENLKQEIILFAKNPKATFSASGRLVKAFKTLQPKNEKFTMLEKLPFNEEFILNNKIYIKKEKRRTRFICINIENKRKYLVTGIAEVELVNKQMQLELF